MNDDLLFSEQDEVGDITATSDNTKEDANNKYIKLLVVDDEKSVHSLTELSLKHETFDGYKIQFLHEFSGKDACEAIEKDGSIAMVLLDVVMEEKDSGLKVVEFVRQKLKNKTIRIILRTGQPGDVPEREVMQKYDINDYKEKTELTSDKLYSTIYNSIRAYNSIKYINEMNKYITCMNVFMKQLINSMPSALIAVDENMKITHWNMDAKKYIRASKVLFDEIEGRLFGDVFYLLSSHTKIIQEVIKTNLIKRVESFKMSNITEGDIFSDIIVYPLKDDDNKVNGAVIRVDDVTAQVTARNKMIQTEKLVTIGTMTAGIVHEIKNPLGIIMSSSTNIKRRVSPDINKNKQIARAMDCDLNELYEYLTQRKVIDFIQSITDAGDRINNIVTNMLSHCRADANIPATLASIEEIIDSTIRLSLLDEEFKQKYNFTDIKIEKNIENGLPEIKCFPAEIEQVLYNFVKNATQAMGSQNEYTDRIFKFDAKKDGDNLIFIFEDNGPGIKKENLSKIFSPLFSTKGNDGNGLGLAICKEIIHKHKGTLDVESEEGKYTKFIIKMPMNFENE